MIATAQNDIQMFQREGYFEVQHLGTYVEHPYKKFIELTIQTCLERGYKLLLVDISKISGFNPSAGQRYEMGELAARLGRSLKRVAVFGTADQLGDRFGTLVARNRGLNVQAFTDREQGLTWLLKGHLEKV